MPATERYHRQVLLWGETRQQQLQTATVLVAGVGGLGATVSQLLVRAGVGKLYLVDDGRIDWPDLNRQLLYGEKDIGRSKLLVAEERLKQINSHVDIELLETRIDEEFKLPAVGIVADCLDNYPSRFSLDTIIPPGTFFVHGGITGDQGQVLTLKKGESQPFSKIFTGACQPSGAIPVSGDNVAVIAGLMANELFRVIFNEPKLLNRCLVVGLGDFHLSFLDV